MLLVEDDDDSATLLTSFARRMGHTVVRTRNGEDAVRVALTSHVDLVFVDLLLPGMTGWEVVHALQSANATAACPIVVCSVLDRHDYPANVQGSLPKPYTRRQFEQVVQQLLPRNLP